jgi:hypothetical protein
VRISSHEHLRHHPNTAGRGYAAFNENELTELPPELSKLQSLFDKAKAGSLPPHRGRRDHHFRPVRDDQGRELEVLGQVIQLFLCLSITYSPMCTLHMYLTNEFLPVAFLFVNYAAVLLIQPLPDGPRSHAGSASGSSVILLPHSSHLPPRQSVASNAFPLTSLETYPAACLLGL